MMLSYKLLLNSPLFVVRIIITLSTIFKLADVSLLLFLLIWPKRQAITIQTSQHLSLDKPCIILTRLVAKKEAVALVTTSQQVGLRNFTRLQEASNTMEEAQYRYHGTTTMELSQRFMAKAHTTQRCSFLSTQMKLPQMVLLHSLLVSGSGWLHKVLYQVCTMLSQDFGNQIVLTKKLEWKQAIMAWTASESQPTLSMVA